MMANESLTLGATRIADFVTNSSASRRNVFLRRFEAVRNIPIDQQKPLLLKAEEFLEQGTVPNQDDVKTFGPNPDDVIAFVSATNTLLSFLRGGESPEDVASGIFSSLPLSSEAKNAVQSLLSVLVQQRPSLDGAYEKRELASNTLPTLEDTNFSVDLRVLFKEGKVSVNTPVVIAHFDTDGMNQELWFQMSKKRLERLIKDLEKIAAEVDVLEKWAEQKP
jgi:hypothetical protein